MPSSSRFLIPAAAVGAIVALPLSAQASVAHSGAMPAAISRRPAPVLEAMVGRWRGTEVMLNEQGRVAREMPSIRSVERLADAFLILLRRNTEGGSQFAQILFPSDKDGDFRVFEGGSYGAYGNLKDGSREVPVSLTSCGHNFTTDSGYVVSVCIRDGLLVEQNFQPNTHKLLSEAKLKRIE